MVLPAEEAVRANDVDKREEDAEFAVDTADEEEEEAAVAVPAAFETTARGEE